MPDDIASEPSARRAVASPPRFVSCQPTSWRKSDSMYSCRTRESVYSVIITEPSESIKLQKPVTTPMMTKYGHRFWIAVVSFSVFPFWLDPKLSIKLPKIRVKSGKAEPAMMAHVHPIPYSTCNT